MFARNSTTQLKSATSQVVKSTTTVISQEQRALLLKKLHNAKLRQILLKNPQRVNAFQRSKEWQQVNSKRSFAEEAAKTEEQKPADAPKSEEKVADAAPSEERATEAKVINLIEFYRILLT